MSDLKDWLWRALRKKSAVEPPLEPPIRLGNFSNGEFFHQATRREEKLRREILRRAGENARRLGMERRDFLASAMGMATSLSVLNLACGSDSREGRDTTLADTSGIDTAGPDLALDSAPSDGGFDIPEDATLDCGTAENILAGDDFIFDIQTHHVEEEGAWRDTNPGSGVSLAAFFATVNGCSNPDPIQCVDAQAYLERVFLESETTMAVLSGFPTALCTETRTSGCGNPLDNDMIVRSRDRLNALAKSQRVVNHCQVNPNDELDRQLAIMERVHAEHGVWGWKCYPEWGPAGTGWMLDDEEVGIPFIEKARELDVKVICIHKGIVFPGWDRAASDPKDVGVVAVRYPDVKFVVYHSAIEIGAVGEGPYDPNNDQGTDRLVRAVLDNDLAGKNVYAELGSVWAQVMNTPAVAQHVIGKLLKNLGPDNVLWGSECVWLGSPQPQIEAFRRFQISEQLRDQHGYPELTPELKAKIFGKSAAAVYGIDPDETRCKMEATELGQLKRRLDAELGARRWTLMQRMGGPTTRREFVRLARHRGGRPG